MRTFWNVVAIVFGVAAFGFIGYRLFWHPPAVTDALDNDGVKAIFYDGAKYEWIWMNWLVTDWVLSLLAAGTAITAAVKNAFSSHTQAQAAVAGAGAVAAPQSVKIDKWVMAFAGLTIIATTLDAKMHAGQQAERYRTGDLIVQDAIMDYRINHDKDALLESWHQAQRVLEGAPQQIDKKGKPLPGITTQGTADALKSTIASPNANPNASQAPIVNTPPVPKSKVIPAPSKTPAAAKPPKV